MSEQVTTEISERERLMNIICENWDLDADKQLNYTVDHASGSLNKFLKFGPLSARND